ncbi:DUF1127 domain-containing protein [Epibacterium sp. Ofav1-8]|uniref:DUF1127 domain-containing protein n=1 Tax=Epibacterium sp. Ofav1-8 TaxID=2917735 RepID=UPI001EF57C8B|nr:DUF1127 domain-containing protein [Epibacterium sp. Ofav1-8]MCG7625275.1 DUF1127 domain-containing protein [Epibacterium sp. Ofav1-8]
MTTMIAQLSLWPAISRVFTRPTQKRGPGQHALHSQARRELSHMSDHMLRDLGL